MRRNKILVVDDESDLRRLIARELVDAGWTVLQASDGRQALEAIDRPGNGIDLAITDIRMPVMDGYELADRLSERSPPMPMIFISGFGQGGISCPDRCFRSHSSWKTCSRRFEDSWIRCPKKCLSESPSPLVLSASGASTSPLPRLRASALRVEKRPFSFSSSSSVVELELHSRGVTVLGVLNEKHHEKGEYRRRRVDDQLPGIAEMKNGPD